jgi:hypothetical protein
MGFLDGILGGIAKFATGFMSGGLFGGLTSLFGNSFGGGFFGQLLSIGSKLFGGLGGNASSSQGGMGLLNGLLSKAKSTEEVATAAKSLTSAVGGAQTQSSQGLNNLFQSFAYNQAKVS